MTRIAIMQPYLFPYAGYYRLFAATDLFVLYDCVQFQRRGYIHRTKLRDALGRPAWLTLRLNKQPRGTLIKELTLATDAEERLSDALRRFPILQAHTHHPLIRMLLSPKPSLVDYLEQLLGSCCDMLGLPFNVVRSSSLDIDPALRGQARILAIARHLGASTYVNAPGGRALYDAQAFHREGIDLRFLMAYRGSHFSILQGLLADGPCEVSHEIQSQLTTA